MSEELDRAWELVRNHSRRRAPETPPDELSCTWLKCEQGLEELFAEHFGRKDVARRLAIPEDYRHFMIRAGGGWHWGPEHVAQSIWQADTVLKQTTEDFQRWVVKARKRPWISDDDMEVDQGLWLSIGWLSDKHATVLCCDRSHSYYGCVCNYHDGHPWFSGLDAPIPEESGEVEGASFLQWLLFQGEDLARRQS